MNRPLRYSLHLIAIATLLLLAACSTGISQEDYDLAIAETDSAQAELEQLQLVYPLRLFKDRAELSAWLVEDNISAREVAEFVTGWLAYALELQKRAADAGYIISAEFADNDDGTFNVWNSAVTQGDEYYWWNPETDELIY